MPGTPDLDSETSILQDASAPSKGRWQPPYQAEASAATSLVFEDDTVKKPLLLIAVLFIMPAPLAFGACQPIPGVAQLWSSATTHWVWVGETHGTAETPAAFGDMVCDALAHGRHVTAALERPTIEQPAVDAIVGSGDRKAAENALLNQPDWREIYDGRTSQAMLDLLFRLRELKAQYPALRVEQMFRT